MAEASGGPWVFAEGPAICAWHPGAAAGWRCERCARDLCAGCAYRDPTPESPLTFCSHCGDLARIRLLPRRSPSLIRQLRLALAPIATPNGALTVGVLAACMSVLELPLRGGIVARLANPGGWLTRAIEMTLFWSVFFEAIKTGRRADPSLSQSTLIDSLGEAGRALLRGSLALLPLLLLATHGRNDILQTISGERRVPPLLDTTAIWSPLDASYWSGFGERTRQAGLLLIGLAAYLAWLSQAFCSFAEERGLRGALHPTMIVRRAQALGADGPRLLAATSLLGGLSVAASFQLTPALASLPFGGFLSALPALALLLMLGVFCGGVVRTRGASLGLGAAELYANPAVNVSPRGLPHKRT